MAYLKTLTIPKCQYASCTRSATKRLVDRWNGERGAYCARHAEPALQHQAKNEAAGDIGR